MLPRRTKADTSTIVDLVSGPALFPLHCTQGVDADVPKKESIDLYRMYESMPTVFPITDSGTLGLKVINFLTACNRPLIQ